MINRPTDQRLRNALAREQIVYVVDNFGIKWSYVAKKMNMQQSNFTHWKSGSFEFGAGKLNMIEEFIDSYLV
ncbi:hypothetical protein QT711_03220 [Sporosarcina saromensis]|uniref:XRE family transcriptional regulator n=1 Tax=Sporosarcina saromensis TaxID=359365 RepID=A0ABU4G5J8_9BACL|nr:hypothetical protein [Sporosarcina saromensis]MDW0112181.1 hypothetical protein [Sporosarcina saromensis]